VDDAVTRRPARFAFLLAALSGAAACAEENVRPRHEVAGGDAARGRVKIAAYGCGSCHSIGGVPGANSNVGPPLDAFAERSYIAGALPNTPESLVRWIMDPQGIEPGTAMPDLGVVERDARDIAAYLYGNREDGLGPPHLIPPSLIEKP
jgi:cytochrome c